MSTDDWARVYVLLALVDVAVTIVLVRAAHRLREPALQERAIVSVILTTPAVAIAVLSGVYLADITMPPGLSGVVVLCGLAVISLPQIVWWLSYRMRRFR